MAEPISSATAGVIAAGAAASNFIQTGAPLLQGYNSLTDEMKYNVQLAYEWEEEERKLKKTKIFQDEELKALRGTIINASKRSIASAPELLKIVVQTAQTHAVPKENLVPFSLDMVKQGHLFDKSPEEMIQLELDFRQAHMNPDISNIIYDIASEFGLKPYEYAKLVRRMARTLKGSGMDESVILALTAMIKKGVSNEDDAFNGLLSIRDILFKGEGNSKEIQLGLKKAGFDPIIMAKDMAGGFENQKPAFSYFINQLASFSESRFPKKIDPIFPTKHHATLYALRDNKDMFNEIIAFNQFFSKDKSLATQEFDSFLAGSSGQQKIENSEVMAERLNFGLAVYNEAIKNQSITSEDKTSNIAVDPNSEKSGGILSGVLLTAHEAAFGNDNEDDPGLDKHYWFIMSAKAVWESFKKSNAEALKENLNRWEEQGKFYEEASKKSSKRNMDPYSFRRIQPILSDNKLNWDELPHLVKEAQRRNMSFDDYISSIAEFIAIDSDTEENERIRKNVKKKAREERKIAEQANLIGISVEKYKEVEGRAKSHKMFVRDYLAIEDLGNEYGLTVEQVFKAVDIAASEGINFKKAAQIIKNTKPAPKASGGPIQANRPYLVGEEGPELIFPEKPGWVASNSLTKQILSPALNGFLDSGVSGLFHALDLPFFNLINPFQGPPDSSRKNGLRLPLGDLDLAGGSISAGIFGALLKQITSPAKEPAKKRGAGIGTIHFSPNITVQGADRGDMEKRIYQAAQQGFDQFRQYFEAYCRDEERVHYGC